MQKTQNIYKSHPQGGEGQVPDTEEAAPRKQPMGSPESGCAAQNPWPLRPAGQAVPTGAQHPACRNPSVPVPAGNGYWLPVFADTGRMGIFINI